MAEEKYMVLNSFTRGDGIKVEIREYAGGVVKTNYSKKVATFSVPAESLPLAPVNGLTILGFKDQSNMSATKEILAEALHERGNQDKKCGQQNWPILDRSADSPSLRYGRQTEAGAKSIVDAKSKDGSLTYMDILLEEVWEAIESPDPETLRKELLQVVAVGVAMIETLDRNGR